MNRDFELKYSRVMSYVQLEQESCKHIGISKECIFDAKVSKYINDSLEKS